MEKVKKTRKKKGEKRKPYYKRKTPQKGPGRPKLYNYYKKKKYKRIPKALRKRGGYPARDVYAYLYNVEMNPAIRLVNTIYECDINFIEESEVWICRFLNRVNNLENTDK